MLIILVAKFFQNDNEKCNFIYGYEASVSKNSEVDNLVILKRLNSAITENLECDPWFFYV